MSDRHTPGSSWCPPDCEHRTPMTATKPSGSDDPEVSDSARDRGERTTWDVVKELFDDLLVEERSRVRTTFLYVRMGDVMDVIRTADSLFEMEAEARQSERPVTVERLARALDWLDGGPWTQTVKRAEAIFAALSDSPERS